MASQKQRDSIIRYKRLIKSPSDVGVRLENLWRLYHKYMDSFVFLLNFYHKTNYSRKFWEIIIGGWVLKLLITCYDKYEVVRQEVALSSPEEILFPNNIERPYYLWNSSSEEFKDEWNEFLLHFIASLYNAFDSDRNKRIFIKYHQKEGRGLFLKRFFDLLFLKVKRVFFKKKISRALGISVYGQGLMRGESLREFQDALSLKKAGYTEIQEININYDFYRSFSPDFHRRRQLFSMVDKSEKFDFIFWNIVQEIFPIYYLECFKALSSEIILRMEDVKLKKIVTFGELSGCLTVNFVVAYQSEKYGAELIEYQHGGGSYGIGKYALSEMWTLNLHDKFISWGWSSKDDDKVIPGFSLKGRNCNFRGKKNQQKNGGIDLFYVTSVYCKYLNGFLLSSPIAKPDDYLKNIKEFLKDILQNEHITTVWRPYTARFDRCDQHVEKILACLDKDRIKKLKIDTKTDFYDALDSTKLFVTDHNATTMLESLSANIPTILFWNQEWQEPRDEAKQGFDELNNVGILHYSPEDASKFIKKNFGNLNMWWHTEKVQDVRRRFVKKYSCITDDSGNMVSSKDIVNQLFSN